MPFCSAPNGAGPFPNATPLSDGGSLVPGGVEVHTAPGDHNTMTAGENAAVLAEKLTAALDSAVSEQTAAGANSAAAVL